MSTVGPCCRPAAQNYWRGTYCRCCGVSIVINNMVVGCGRHTPCPHCGKFSCGPTHTTVAAVGQSEGTARSTLRSAPMGRVLRAACITPNLALQRTPAARHTGQSNVAQGRVH